jgi:uncharacterized protein (DUF169 family)
MQDLESISQDLVSHLGLRYVPVGVKLFKKGTALPQDIPLFKEELKSYCQALVRAGCGDVLLLQREKMGCKLGTSVLGFEEDMEAFLDDGVLEKFGVGLFATEEASAETIHKSFYLEKGKTVAALIAPLATFEEVPQVIIFTVNSEQVMWLLYAVNYERGGRMDLPQSGGALGGCSDITVWPIQEGNSNITFLGLGCRMKTGLDSSHLMMGIPGDMLEKVYTHVLDMAKPIAMLKKAGASGDK